MRKRGEMVVHDEAQHGFERIHRGVGAGCPLGSIGRIEDQFLAPDEPGLRALLDLLGIASVND